MTERTILQIVKMDDTRDSCYRMRWPARAFAAAHPSYRVINLDAVAGERYSWALHADLLVVFQSLDTDLLPIIEERRRLGRKTLVEYNDNFYNPQAWSPVAKDWNSHRVWNAYESFMKASDGVLVTGEGLFTLFKGVVDVPIHILENDLPEPPRTFETYLSQKTVYPSFGWAGSLGHMADLLAVVPVIKEILAAVPESKFHVMGNESIPHHLQIPKERIVYTPWGTMEEYFRFWEPVHVGIAPLLDTPYNQCRSDIKAVEMSSRAVVPVLTDLLPYKNLLSSLELPLLSGFPHLRSVVQGLLVDAEGRTNIAERCYSYVKETRIDSGKGKRAALYDSLMAQAPIGFSWPMPLGYHEIVGTPLAQPPSQEALQKGQLLLKEKKGADAVAQIREASQKNPYSADLRVALLQLLRASRDPRFDETLDAARIAFRKEPRLWTLYVQAAGGAEQSERWREFFVWLRTQSSEYTRSVSDEVCHAMSVSLAQDETLAGTAEELLLFYPFAYQIRFQVAEAFERTGKLREAKAHFATLCRAKAEFEAGSRALAGFDAGYLQAWSDAINARMKGEFR